jgi:hypothetical protein
MPIKLPELGILGKITLGMCGSFALPGGVAGIVASAMGGSANQIATAVGVAGSSGVVIVSLAGLWVYQLHMIERNRNQNNAVRRDSVPEDRAPRAAATPPPSVIIPMTPSRPVVNPITVTVDPHTPDNSCENSPISVTVPESISRLSISYTKP